MTDLLLVSYDELSTDTISNKNLEVDGKLQYNGTFKHVLLSTHASNFRLATTKDIDSSLSFLYGNTETSLRIVISAGKLRFFTGLFIQKPKPQIPSHYVIAGNIAECAKIVFVNQRNEIEASIVPDINGDFIFYTDTNLNVYDVIFITNNPLKDNILYREISPNYVP